MSALPTSYPSSLAALVARDVAMSYGDLVVLDGVDLVASPAAPVGLVGENGTGKTTLLRVLAGDLVPDRGEIARPADLGFLPQDPTFPAGSSVGDVLESALAPLHALVARVERLAGRLGEAGAADRGGAGDAYADALARADLHDAWNADHRAETAAARLGLDRIDRDRPVGALSGGERTRLCLAALITRRPGCVLLDEPTNHLDDDAVGFLETFLRELPGVVVATSHDRTFLDHVCAAVVDLDPTDLGSDGGLGTRFTGGYSAYLDAKRRERERWQAAFEAQQDELAELRESARTTRHVAHNRAPRDSDGFIHHFKGENVARTVARRVRDTDRRIATIERQRVPKPPRALAFRGTLAPTPAPASRVVQVRDLVVRDRLAVHRLDVAGGGRLLVTGANGSGKSTLLKVLAGQLAPTSGTATVSARRVGLLPQDVTFSDPDTTPEAVFARAAPSGPSAVRLGELGLLHPRDLTRPVGRLSVGQRRRLALALLVARRPDLLLLDEPTNHISLRLAEELEEALVSSPGTVVVASHDRWLRSRWTGPELVLDATRQRVAGKTQPRTPGE